MYEKIYELCMKNNWILLILQVDESELQDEPLQLRLMDHDTYSANDAIGKVVIGLAPLLAREGNKTKTAASQGGKSFICLLYQFD